METRIEVIDLATPGLDLKGAITDLCDAMAFQGYRLATTFLFKTKLTMIFQSEQVQGAK